MTGTAAPCLADLPRDWPLVEHSRIVPVAPHRWHVQMAGQGPDVLLLHGAGASTHSWRHMVPDLTMQYRVTVIDLPGHGFTRLGVRGRSSLVTVARDIAVLLKMLSVSPRLIVGHSAGAAVALQLTYSGAVQPRGLVAVNGALEDFKGPAGWLFPMMAKALVLNPFTGIFLSRSGASMSSVRNLISSTGSTLPPEGLAFYQRLISDRRHIDGTLAMMANWSLSALNRALPEITTPALFLHGTRDRAVPHSVAARAAAAMPSGIVTLLPDVGHLAHEEVPEQVMNAVQDFDMSLPAG
ncbi:MAG: alpha/beta fold hydrolase [Rhodobacteraceae bacterium]|nr:alpha/beta fold hydrolase [Paracoccaceae bacterium]